MKTTNISKKIFTTIGSSKSYMNKEKLYKKLSSKNNTYKTTSGSLIDRIASKPMYDRKGTVSNKIMTIISKRSEGVTFDKILLEAKRNNPVQYRNYSYIVKRALLQLINWKLVNVNTNNSGMFFTKNN